MSTLRYALRQRVQRPASSFVIVAMLALGIGATTGIYSIYYTALLKPLPVPEPERLVNLVSHGPKPGMQSTGRAGRAESVFSYPMFRDLQAQQQVFTGVAAHRSFDANFAFGEQSISGTGILVSGEYFPALELQPALGRLIGPQDEPRIGESAVAVLSYEFWQNYFDGDPGVVNQAIRVNGQSLTIVGVAPETFKGTTLGLAPRVFVPLTLRWMMSPTAMKDADNRRSYWVYLFARLADGIDRAQASASVNAIYGGILAEIEAPLNADLPADVRARFLQRTIELSPGERGQSNVDLLATRPLRLLLVITGLVLVIVCVNIASLLIASSETRMNETAIRTSLGATRGRVVKEFLLEAALLALVGGAASFPVAAATIRVVVGLMPPAEAATIAFALEPQAYAFIGALTAVTVLLFGLFPALRAARVEPNAVLNAYDHKATGGRVVLRFRSLLATGQIALSMLLLAMSGLFVQSLMKISTADLGMDVDSLVTFSVSPRLNGYGVERTRAVFDAIEASLQQQPGVTGVATSGVQLLSHVNWNGSLNVEDRPSGAGVDTYVWINRVGEDFFDVLSIPLLFGRAVSATDRLGAPPVAIVNQAFLSKFDYGAAVLGKRFAFGGPDAEPDIEIVGVVADTKYSDVKANAPPQIFLPRAQEPNLSSLTYYVRSNLGADRIMASVRRAVASVDPTLPVENMAAVSDVVEENAFLDRIIGTASAGLAALATVLAALGLYSVLAYSVTRRTRELGIRLALGATPMALRIGVFGQVARMAVIGGAIGLALALVAGRAAESLLYEISAFDPVALVSAALAIFFVVSAAASIPAARAARTAPMEALRYE